MEYKMLENKVAIVTGGSSGIGFGIASALAEKGAMVYLVARGKEKLEEAQAKIQEAGGSAEIRSGSITNLDFMKQIVESVYGKEGRLDFFVNNAGAWKGQTLETDFSEIRKLIELNMMAPYELTHYLINRFKGEKNDLKILTVSSQAAVKVFDMGLGYGVSKTGLTSGLFHLDKQIQEEDIKNIQLYRLYPGTVATEGLMEAIKAGEVQNPTTLSSVVDGAMDLVLGKTKTRDLKIGYYPGRGIVRTHLSSNPGDFYRPLGTEEVIDLNFRPTISNLYE